MDEPRASRAGSEGPFYGQHGEDAVLWEAFGRPEDGYYVEVGALDGLRFSNTLYFEQRGWEGVLVEPHPDYFPLLEANRPGSVCVEAAASDVPRQRAPLYAAERGALSTLDADSEAFFRRRFRRWFSGFTEREVRVRTLTEILREAGAPHRIDVVSVDVEGHEVPVLRGLDLEVYRPRVIVAEAMTEEAAAKLTDHLTGRGYELARRLAHNLFFADTPELADRLSDADPEGVELVHHPHPLDAKGSGLRQVTNWVHNSLFALVERLRGAGKGRGRAR